MVLHIPESVCVLHPSVLTVTVPMQTPSFKVGVGAGGTGGGAGIGIGPCSEVGDGDGDGGVMAGGKPALVGIIEGGAEPPPIEQPGMYSHEAIGTMVHDGSVTHALELSSQ